MNAAVPSLGDTASRVGSCINCSSPGNLLVTFAAIRIGFGWVTDTLATLKAWAADCFACRFVGYQNDRAISRAIAMVDPEPAGARTSSLTHFEERDRSARHSILRRSSQIWRYRSARLLVRPRDLRFTKTFWRLRDCFMAHL
jgi:hypothetical protein